MAKYVTRKIGGKQKLVTKAKAQKISTARKNVKTYKRLAKSAPTPGLKKTYLSKAKSNAKIAGGSGSGEGG
jgi:hypothetical protein